MLIISISNDRQNETVQHLSGPIELGRSPGEGLARRVIVEDRSVSRDQLRLESLAPGTIELENLGRKVEVTGQPALEKSQHCRLTLPTRIVAGDTTIDIVLAAPAEEDSALQTIARPLHGQPHAGPQESLQALGQSPSVSTLTRWFETLMSVQRAAAGSGEFYQQTARAVVTLVGLDRGMVLLREEDDWKVLASNGPQISPGHEFSRGVLHQVVVRGRTYYEAFNENVPSPSLLGVEAVVASPIFDAEDQVTGVVYGSRDLRDRSNQPGIQPLEAQLVQLLAGAVSAGLARLEQESRAVRNRVLFEQFASPEVARELELNPDLLEGRDQEVTILFSDLRDSTAISERLGARLTYDLLSELMNRLSDRIKQFEGFLIDYYGDGLCTMWNAPTRQEGHATLAVQAAGAMLEELPDLNRSWQERLGQPLCLGIGIHTGIAQVGNAGSQQKVKYGPRGKAVNLASRIEGATKHLGGPILITESTRAMLPEKYITRRLCRVRVVGIAEAVNVFEVHGTHAEPDWLSFRDAYEQALECFEKAEWPRAEEILRSLSTCFADEEDRAHTLLLQQVGICLANKPEKFDGVFRLTSK